jgi:hypothetical protein
MKAQRKPEWIVRVAKRDKSSYGIESLYLDFRQAVLCDAAEELADAARRGGSDQAHYTEKCRVLHEETGKTLYFDAVGSNRSSFTLHAQRNVDRADPLLCGATTFDWYGLSMHSGDITEATVAALHKLVRIDTPEAAIAALKATYATYCEAVHDYVACERPAILDPLPVPETAAEATT